MYKIILSLSIFISTFLCASEVVNVYSHRHYAVDKKLYKLFEKQAGIKVNLIKASSAELIKRIEKEGKYQSQTTIAKDIDSIKRTGWPKACPTTSKG